MNMIEQFTAARRAKAPIVVIRTPDPASTIDTIKGHFLPCPIAQWNICEGITEVNDAAKKMVKEANAGEDPASVTGNPVEALRKALAFTAGSILIVHNAHLYLEKGGGDSHKPIIQAVWNLRDRYKATDRTAVLLCPVMQIPEELKNDVVMIDEPLPTEKELAAIVVKAMSEAKDAKPVKESHAIVHRAIHAVSGLSAFNAGQVIGMAMRDDKLDIDLAWEHKINLIELERGLRVHRFGPTFKDIGGNDNIKTLFGNVAKGKKRPTLIVFIDEIEKAMAAAGTDTSGTTTDQLKVFLTEMQNNEWSGVILYGFPGTGKSELAKAFGSECKCVTVEADLGSMKNRWVGSSEARMRSFIKTIKAMGGPNIFFVATCNIIDLLRAELVRRFNKGIVFCPPPQKAARDKIWEIWLKKCDLSLTEKRPDDEGWVGADISACSKNAAEYGISLIESSHYVTPVLHAMGDKVEKMMREASGRYINAEEPGKFIYKPKSNKNLMQYITGGK